MEVVLAQLVERSIPTPEVRGSNPVIGKICVYYQLYWKDENKEKEAWNGPFLKKKLCNKSADTYTIVQIAGDGCGNLFMKYHFFNF